MAEARKRVRSVPPLPSVTGVEVVGMYELRLTFDDGTVGDVSFADRDWTGVFEPLRDPARFAKVAVDRQCGTIVWPEHGLDMAPEPLYEEARRRPAAETCVQARPADGRRPFLSAEQVQVVVGTLSFDRADYDAGNDVLALRIGEPRSADGEETPEGHFLRYAPGTDRVVGLTLIGARGLLERDGRLVVSVPEQPAATPPPPPPPAPSSLGLPETRGGLGPLTR